MSLITADQLKDQPQESPMSGIWAKLKQQLEFAQYRPQIVDNLEISTLSGRQGSYYVVKNSQGTAYYRLDERDHFLWTQMNGTHSVKDLVVSYFTQYGAFAFARVGSLVQGLKEGGFLIDHPTHLYGRVSEALFQQQLSYRLQKALRIFTGQPIALNNVDEALGTIYRRGAWLLFTKPVQIVLILVIAAGLFLFAGFVFSGEYSLSYTGSSLVLGIIILFALNLFAIFLHEMSHALTVKHFGRRVRSGGFLLYYGMPAFFIDTTDIWMQQKKARLAVTWAGPHGSLVVVAVSAILMAISPWPALDSLLYIIAFVTFVGVFLNLNPLLELDGYFLLMDWLEIPMLRAKSLGFVRSGLWSKLNHAAEDSSRRLRTFFSPDFWATLSREEKFFTVFGLLSAAWSVIAIGLSIRFWRQKLSDLVVQLWYDGNMLTRIVLGLAGLVVVVVVFLAIARMARPSVRRFFGWTKQKNLFASTWRIAAILVVGSALVAWISSLLSAPFLTYGIALCALLIGGFLAWQDGRTVQGALQSKAFVLLTLWMAASFLSTLLLFASQANSAGAVSILLPAILATSGAGLAGLLAALVLLHVEGFSSASRLGQGLVVLGALASFLIALLENDGQLPATATGWLAFGSVLAPLLAVALLLPTVISSWATDFGPTWVVLALAFCLIAPGTHLAAATALAYLLAAAGMFLYRTAFDRLNYTPQHESTAYLANDRALLGQAYVWTLEGLLVQHQAMAGRHRSQRLIERFNKHATATNWVTSLVGGQIESNLPPDLTLPEQGHRYGAALSLFLDLMKLDVGELPALSALRRSYEALPWEHREIISTYALNQIDQADSFSRQFESQRSDHTMLLRQMPVLSAMTDEEIALVASRLTSRRLAKGEVLIKQGDRGDNLYIIRSGHVEVSVQHEHGYVQVVGQLGRGDYVGEAALITDEPRNATCKAILPTEVLVLSRDDFVELVKDHFQMGEKVNHSLQVMGLLRQIPVFSGIDGKTLKQLAARLKVQKFETGSPIIRQGEIGVTFYVIESGQVEVFVTQDNQEKILNQLGPGAYFGEIALLMNVPRTASVRVLTPTVALAMHRHEFERFVNNDLYANKVLELETSRRLHSQQRLAAPARA